MAHDLAACASQVQQLPLVHQGLPLIGASPTAYAVRAAAEVLDSRRREILRDLQGAAPDRIAVLGDHFDAITSMLEVLGIGYRGIASEDLAVTGAALVFVGCSHRHTRLDLEDARSFLDHGGVLVSSCRAAHHPGIAGHLPFDRPGGPRRARIIAGDGATPDGGMLYPAVALDHGHIPLSYQVDDYRDVTVLARDVLDNRPIVAVVGQGRGAIVHSVAHWWQAKAEAMTELERRPLTQVRSMTRLANSHADLTWGSFQAASVMLAALLDGVDIGLRQSRPAVLEAGPHCVWHEED